MFLTTVLIAIGIFFISHNHLLSMEFNVPAYFIGLLANVIAIIMNLKSIRTIDLKLLVYLFVVLVSQFLYMLMFQGAQDGLQEALVIYVIFPIIAMCLYKIMLETPSIAVFLLYFVSSMSALSFVGSILYMLVNLNLLTIFQETFRYELTKTGGEFQIKNTSFYGSSLTLGGLSLVQASASIYMYLKTRKKIFIIFFMLASAVCLLSLARRAMIPLFLLTIIAQFFFSQKQKFIAAGIFSVVVSTTIIAFYDVFIMISKRFFSSFNLTDASSGNEARLSFMSQAIEIILTNPMGVGLANLSSLGKTKEDLIYGKPNGFITTAESTYLVFIGEIGIIGCVILLPLLISFLARLSRFSFWLVIAPFALEATFGLSIYSLTILSLLLIVLLSIETVEKSFPNSQISRYRS